MEESNALSLLLDRELCLVTVGTAIREGGWDAENWCWRFRDAPQALAPEQVDAWRPASVKF
jgi:hypothetical protein